LGAGLVLTALPAGFAVAALSAPAILPSSLSDHQRATLGTLICVAALTAALGLALTAAALVPVLALVGVGLGVFTPSNNAMIMGAIPVRSSATGGGLLNLTRGLGTALGVALVTLALHLGSAHPGGISGARLALLILLGVAVVAACASWIPRRASLPPASGRGDRADAAEPRAESWS
jgi:MFS family permease